MNDISHLLSDIEDMPLCPICDQPISTHELVQIGVALGCAALVHQDCLESEDE